MRRAGWVSLAFVATICVVGSAADAAGTGWHVTPVRSLGARLGSPQAAAVNRFGTSVVVFASGRSLTVVRRTAHGSRFKTTGRASTRKPSALGLSALADGRFLLVYTTGDRLLARHLDAAGRFLGTPHVLATGYATNNGPVGDMLPLVAVDSDASRAVVVWGPIDGPTYRVEGAIDGHAGWSNSKILHSESSEPDGPFIVQVASDAQDRFLVSVHGTNGDTAAVMWGVPPGSQQWEQVTPPQAADGSALASYNGATLARVNGTITAAWQDSSAALVVSTWAGSTWTTPVTAIAGSYDANGHPVGIYPLFVSNGTRAAIVWSDQSKGLLGPIKATIRTSSTGSWSAPLVFPRSLGDQPFLPFATPESTFWFTASGALAGVWQGYPIKRHQAAGLYVGRVAANAASSTALSRMQNPNNGRGWFVLPRAGGLHTIVWAGKKGREFSATATGNGLIRGKRPLPACGYPWGVSNPDALAQLLVVTNNGPVGGNGTKCPLLLLW